MGKHLVYIAGAFAIIIVLCSVTATASRKNVSTTKPITTNKINDIQIDKGAVTTNIWDYLNAQKESNVIGDSNEDEPELSIILK